MSVKWTKEQQQVIELKNRNILVSAAAGSGKTAVLVERIIRMLTRKEDPLQVDQLLIVTFTEAAAAQMKERVCAAIEEKLLEFPENEHLRQQAALIHSAQITTIHSFCLSVIREHFHRIDLDPSFRIGEEGELKLLCHDVLRNVIEAFYQEGDEKFLEFVEAYAAGRDDRKLEELVLRLYEFSRSCPDPERWLLDCVQAYRLNDIGELEQTQYYARAKENVYRYMESAFRLAEDGLRVCREPDGPYMYEEAFLSDRRMIQAFMSAGGYREFYEVTQDVSWVKFAANRDKNVSKEKADRAKKIREEMKKMVRDVTEQYFACPPETALEDMRRCAPMIEVLSGVVLAFGRAFEEAKRARNLIDFDDMEQYALRILTDKTENGLVPSAAAREYKEQFREVMIDEYQDSNLIQEAILTSVSGADEGRYNIFMVGDVKQSIYRFRLSRPELFMEKFDSYDLTESRKQRVDLHKNFRSRKEVLDSVNFLFRQMMTRELGGVAYDDKAALYVGAKYEPSADKKTEILIVNTERGGEAQTETEFEKISAKEMEARVIAGEIRRLKDTQQVTDKDTGKMRPVRYSDIVILTRSVKGFGDVLTEVLMRGGIPAYADKREGYFETQEIGVLLDYLSVLNNQQQDIPLASVLRSYFGGFTDEEMAVVKSTYPELAFHQAVAEFAVCEEVGGWEEGRIRSKLKGCLGQLSRFREMVVYMPIHELLWKILEETGYGDYILALPGGSQRYANVEMLIEKAIAFGSTSYKGLFNFIRYIDQLKKYEVDYGEANIGDEQSDTVRVMSIHKSKGLEFPVVIVAGMGKRFNMQDLKGSVLIHAGLGAGLDSVDVSKRTRAPSFLKNVIQREERLEALGEELRVLYVAFTRAKEKLIITGVMKEPDEILRLPGEENFEESISFGMLSRASSYWDWLIPALKNRTGREPLEVRIVDFEGIAEREVLEEMAGTFTRKALEDWDTTRVYDEEMHRILKEQFDYRYPYDDLKGKKIKFTVSELKKRKYLELDDPGEFLVEEEPVLPLVPKFLKAEEKAGGAARGSAYHRVLELLDFACAYDGKSVREAIEDMVRRGRISRETADMVRSEDILAFMKSGVAARMQRAAEAGRLFKESPFVLGIPMSKVYGQTAAEEEETVLVQGIIDVYFEEEDGLVVLDYKTDQASCASKLADKYRLQLEYYAQALEQITGKTVKEKIIYSVALEEEILL